MTPSTPGSFATFDRDNGEQIALSAAGDARRAAMLGELEFAVRARGRRRAASRAAGAVGAVAVLAAAAALAVRSTPAPPPEARRVADSGAAP